LRFLCSPFYSLREALPLFFTNLSLLRFFDRSAEAVHDDAAPTEQYGSGVSRLGGARELEARARGERRAAEKPGAELFAPNRDAVNLRTPTGIPHEKLHVPKFRSTKQTLGFAFPKKRKKKDKKQRMSKGRISTAKGGASAAGDRPSLQTIPLEAPVSTGLTPSRSWVRPAQISSRRPSFALNDRRCPVAARSPDRSSQTLSLRRPTTRLPQAGDAPRPPPSAATPAVAAAHARPAPGDPGRCDPSSRPRAPATRPRRR